MTTLETMSNKDFQSNWRNPVAAMDSKDFDSSEQMPIKAMPYAHQIIGYNMACRILRITKGGD